MPAISEYAKVTAQRVPLSAPENLGDVLKWVVVLLAAYLVIRLLGAVVRWLGR